MKRIAVVFLSVSLAGGAGCAPTSRPLVGQSGRSAPPAGPDATAADRENARALDLLGAGRYDRAEVALKAALAADGGDGRVHNNLGTAYFHQGKYYLAAWEYQHAAKLMPGHPEPCNNLGMVFEKVGKLDDAVQWYGRAVEMKPDDPQLVGNLARALVRRGDDGDALRNLLAKIVSTDMRPQWVGWARDRLALLREPTTQAADGASEGG